MSAMRHADTKTRPLPAVDWPPYSVRRTATPQVFVKLCRSVGVSLGLAALAGPVLAQPVRIVWSTYLRTGPGSGYAVVDEIQPDTLVDLRTCNAHWCQILSGQTLGYVDKDSITLPRLPGGGAPIGGPQKCFVAGQYAWRTPAKTRFCETKPKG